MEKLEVDDITSPSSISFFFHISMWWRIFYGSLRLVLGLVLLKLVGSSFSAILASLFSYELIEDPSDTIFRTLYLFFENHTFTVTYFLAGYLLFWGILDIGLSLLLLRHKLWAFPVSIALIALFLCYSVLRLTHTHSPVLAFIIFVDTVILYLIYREYNLLRKKIIPM